LQKRTAVERERILTERIAEILMGCKDFTQRFQKKIEESNDIKEKIVIKSQLLQQLRQIVIPIFLCNIKLFFNPNVYRYLIKFICYFQGKYTMG